MGTRQDPVAAEAAMEDGAGLRPVRPAGRHELLGRCDEASPREQELAYHVSRQAARRIDGEELMTITIDSFEINPKVDLNLFKKPAE